MGGGWGGRGEGVRNRVRDIIPCCLVTPVCSHLLKAASLCLYHGHYSWSLIPIVVKATTTVLFISHLAAGVSVLWARVVHSTDCVIEDEHTHHTHNRGTHTHHTHHTHHKSYTFIVCTR